MTARLPDCDFKYSYGPGDDRINDFYVPALSASIHYDRTAGFFSSTALAAAAVGVARLIGNDGRMRLLVGAQLSKRDVEAIRKGYDLRQKLEEAVLRQLQDPADEIARHRLAALAWMIHAGHLDIKVVLPLDPHGNPLPDEQSTPYFHTKYGIFTDTESNRLAFMGSVNESVTSWRTNYENFVVFRSWPPGGQPVYVRDLANKFKRLWDDREPDWRAVPIPDAARQKLLRYRSETQPTRDPLEREPEPPRTQPEPVREEQRERIIAQFLRDAPHLMGATGLGAATSAVTPWPHQQTVTHDVVAGFPKRFLLADEVGLGKTIEAGLILRQLYLSGLVRRALILAPKSVLKQWQEELYEKFALNVPRYDGAVFIDHFGVEIAPDSGNLWDDVEIALASSQLMKRTDRQKELIEAREWGLVLVDEAHHARRKDFLNLNTYRPNRLLELLNAIQARTECLLLMTATPMQVHPIEVWDLANLLGLSGDWGAGPRKFLRYFNELRADPTEAEWAFVFGMVQQEVKFGGLDPRFVARERERLGPVDWTRVEGLISDRSPSKTMAALAPAARAAAIRMAENHTPLRRLLYRNTRELLRRYREQGLLDANVPSRLPEPVWVPMSSEEEILYVTV